MAGSARHCWLDGRLVSEAEANVSAVDRGLLYADGLFETVRVYGGRAFRLAAHWKRLAASARALGLPVPDLDPAAGIAQVLAANQLTEASVRLTLTRGSEPGGPRPAPGPEGTPTLLVQARPLRPTLAAQAEAGLAGRRLPWPLRARGLWLQNHKTLAYLPSVVALGQVPAGEEPILENTEGHLAEGATTNLFWVRGRRLFTPCPEAGCLPGLARALVLELAPGLGLETEAGFYPAGELLGADEAFVTNSVVEVLPLVAVDGRPVADGRPGPTTRALQQAYRATVTRELDPP
ncbi:MAG: aminotransferase class IV [Deferrisomatales bacterium]